MAGRTGLILELTRSVLGQAMADVARWGQAGHRLGLAVNVSPRVLTDDALSRHLAEGLLRWNIDPSSLTLEVTESVVLSDSARIEQTLLKLEELGGKLSIDDYGTGYSSLSYLQRLNVHEIKVDKSFVADMMVNPQGVEDMVTLQRLRDMECDRAQGFLIARPMPASDLLAFVQAHDPSRAFREA